MKIAQIEEKDTKFHLEAKELPRLILKLFGEKWINNSAQVRTGAALFRTPCLTEEEIESLFNTEFLFPIKEKIWNSIHFWDGQN
jgi:hypothetical protein